MIREINMKSDLKAIKEVRKIIKKEKPDIVYLHSSKAGAIGRIALMFSKKIKIFYNAHGWYFNAQISKKKKIVFRIIEKILAIKTDKIINISKSEYDSAIKYKIASILTLSFTFLLTLNNTKIATPVPVNNPAKHEENDMILSIYNWVRKTLDAQLGIRPIKLDIKGLRKLFFKNSFSIAFLPKKLIPTFNKNVINIINNSMLIVCLIDDFNIPCLQLQWLSSQNFVISFAFLKFSFLITKSIINPHAIPIIIFKPIIEKIDKALAPFEIKIGSISSDVDKYIDISVPKLIILVA